MENPYLYQMSSLKRKGFKMTSSHVEWAGNSFVFHTDEGIRIFEIKDYFLKMKNCNNKSETLIPSSKQSPASDSFKNFEKVSIPNIDFAEMNANPSLWPFSSYLREEYGAFIESYWSPKFFLDDSQSHYLAAVSNLGQIEIYAKKTYRWVNVLDLSSLVEEKFAKVKRFAHLKSVQQEVNLLETVSFCWGCENKNVPGSIFCATAQRNGDIIFWLIQKHEEELQGKILSKIPGHIEIRSLIWHEVDNNTFWLFYSNIDGEVKGKLFRSLKEKIMITETIFIWNDKDRMEVRNIKILKQNEKTIIVFSKFRYIIVQAFDDKMQPISQHSITDLDHPITSLAMCKNNLYIGTRNVKIFQLNVKLVLKEVRVMLHVIPVKEDYSEYELWSLDVSENGCIWTMALHTLSPIYERRLTNLMLTFNTLNTEDLPALLEDTSQCLNNKLDYIEVIKYKSHSVGCIPITDFHELYTGGENNMYKLKIYLILLKLYLKLKSVMMKNLMHFSLPETSVDNVKELILFKHAVSTVKKLLHSYIHVVKRWTEMEKDTFVFAKDFMNYYCKKHKKDITEYIDISKVEKIKVNKDYVCLCCDSHYDGSWYGSEHINIYCMLTFSPIYSEQYLYCNNCKTCAQPELYNTKPMCLFCDAYLLKDVT